MGRMTKDSEAYGFHCRAMGWGYEISWTVDFHYADSCLRYPRTFRRTTDAKGADRFCKKHGLKPLEAGKKGDV
jgi:hypothetical protein